MSAAAAAFRTERLPEADVPRLALHTSQSFESPLNQDWGFSCRQRLQILALVMQFSNSGLPVTFKTDHL
jgi:hypothetical protein